jgi:alpha-glucosidase
MLKDATLRDNPLAAAEHADPFRHYGGQEHCYDEDQPEVHEVIRRWRRILDAYGERMMVGEVYLFDPARIATYYGNGQDELNLAFNFRFMWSPWEAEAFRERVDEIERLLPQGAQPTYVLSSHDAPRHRSRFDDPVHGAARARLAVLMLLTLRGTPFLYYGDEIGMRDVVIPTERICDPVGKRFPGLGRDPERTPMQWSAARHGGFSTADPWLPLADDCAAHNVQSQIDDGDSLLSFYRRLIWYRKQSAALLRGSYRPLDGPADTFVYVREDAQQRLLVALNFGHEIRHVELPFGGHIELSTHRARPRSGTTSIELQPNEGAIVAP